MLMGYTAVLQQRREALLHKKPVQNLSYSCCHEPGWIFAKVNIEHSINFFSAICVYFHEMMSRDVRIGEVSLEAEACSLERG